MSINSNSFEIIQMKVLQTISYIFEILALIITF